MRKQNIVMIFGHYNGGNSIVFLVITRKGGTYYEDCSADGFSTST